MIIAPAVMLHKYWLQSKKLRAAKRRGYLFDAPPAPHAQLGPSLVDLDSLSRAHPQRFYLPDASFEALSDCYARVEGVRLPLHGQVLAARCSVLRQLFVAQAEDGAGAAPTASSQAPIELSSAFSGCSLREVATFLRLIYSPDHATPGSLRSVHKFTQSLLAAVAGLAHRLDAAGLLARIESYLQSASVSAEVAELIDTIQLAEACHLGGLADTCLSLLARKLAASGPYWHEQVNQAQLAECNSESLAALACKMAGHVHAGAFEPPAVHGILRGRKGSAGGFTWVIKGFSKQQGRVTSPWVEVGGVEWRLKVWPKGDDAAGGTHLSAYLECNYAQAVSVGLTSIEAFYDFSFLDQSEEGLHFSVDCGKDMFTATTQNWGKTRMMPLEELRRPDRQYLDQDRLAVRIAIRVVPPGSSTAAPPPAAPAPAPAPLFPAAPAGGA